MSNRRNFRKFVRGAITAGLAVSMTAGAISFGNGGAKAASSFNYGDAWAKSIMFYEFQKSGDLPEDQRNNWRGDSGMNDGQDVGVDLTGGWYDAGDHVKFNLPMSYTAAMLAWSYLEDTDVYIKSGQDKYILDEIKWANDYFIKCHVAPNEYYYQVGNGGVDHSIWCSAEVMQMERPAYKLDMSNPGSAVSAETAASLAACAIVFKDIDPAYSATCLSHAKQLLSFAEATKSDDGYMKQAAGYYSSFSGFYDELSWASMWLYLATDDEDYVAKAKQYSSGWSKKDQSDEIAYAWGHSWDDVHIGASLLLAKYAGEEKYKDVIEKHLDYWTVGYNGERVQYTPKGLAWLDQWGSLRYATTTGFLAAIYADWDGADSTRAEYCQEFAKSQADYALGSTGRSFVIGFGQNPPKNPHHRTAHGAWENNVSGQPEESRHTLVGALVGGPNLADAYEDKRSDYIANEVADDYNAGFVGLMAKMYDDYGGTIDPNLNAFEPVGEELFMNVGINAQDKNNTINFIELKAIVYNHTAWPARVTDKLSYRYFVDISDVLAAGYSAADMKISSSYSQGVSKISGLKPWDAANGIYYVDIDLSGDKIYPGGQSEQRRELQFRIAAPGRWDYTKSPSFQGLASSGPNTMVRAEHMALYDNGVLVFGSEPDGHIVTPTYIPTPTDTPTDIPTPTDTPTDIPTPTDTPTDIPTPTDTPTDTPTPTSTPTPIIPSGNTQVTLQSQGTATTNTLGGQFTLTSKDPLDLSKTAIRYYYTVEGNASQSAMVDHADMSLTKAPWYTDLTSAVSVNLVQVSGNQYYAEITFDSDAVLDEAGKVQMGIRIFKSDWSNYDQTNDYSYTSGAVVLYNGIEITGTSPY